MSFFKRAAAFLGLASVMMPTPAQANKWRETETRKKLSDHEKLEKHYQSCGLKKWPLVKRYVGTPILNAQGQPLHVYALNERNYSRKIVMYSQNPKSIPTFA